MGKHEITMGKEAITDIGYLIQLEIEKLKTSLMYKENLVNISVVTECQDRKEFWEGRIKELETEIAKHEGYHKIIMGASSITVEHDVITEQE